MASTTFKTLSDVKKEQRMLFLYLPDEDDYTYPIAYATSANLSYSVDTIDVGNKTDGMWQTVMNGKKSAEISVDALCAYNAEHKGEAELQAAYNGGTKLRFIYAYFTITESADGLTTTVVLDDAKPMYTGYMLISSLELTSDNGDVAKFSVSAASQGSVIPVMAFTTVAGVSVEKTSVTVPDNGVGAAIVWDSTAKKFLLHYMTKYYSNWSGNAPLKSDYYDDDEVRTDRLYINDSILYKYDEDDSDLVEI